MEGRVFEKFQKNQKIFKIPKKLKIVPKSVQTCFEHVLWSFFSKKIFAQCSMEGRVFENFQKKIKKFSKFQKCSKSFPKVSKRVLNMFWGNFFGKNFLPSVPWRVESSKIFQKIKKVSKFQKCSKPFPKVSKRVLNMFWGNFFGRKFLPSVPWRVESSKNFKKIQKIFKIPKKQNSKSSSQKCPNENFKNQKNFFQTCPKSFVVKMFWGNFFEKNFCPVFHGGSSLRKFSKKNQKIFKIPKMLKIVPKSVQTCFEHVLG